MNGLYVKAIVTVLSFLVVATVVAIHLDIRSQQIFRNKKPSKWDKWEN